ncbi:MAG: MATE family efflux transporter [Clostridia bacterium]|nr:MATE family efflux transporter [Clostridia bacterium]
MQIRLSDHFSYKKLIRFTLPSIIMMIFTSVYGVVDGVFVSNFVGKTPFAAINLIMPVCMLFGALGFMVGTGGSALVSKILGEGDRDKANKIFSLLVYFAIIFGAALSALGIIFIEPISVLLGAEGEMLRGCVLYGRILFFSLVPFILQNVFQSFLVVAEKPKLGLAITVAAGVTNIVLDALFVAVFEWGLAGAASATAISQTVGGIIPLIYFFTSKKNQLKLGRTSFDGKALLHTCANGSSEMMTNISLSLVNMLYNFQLMRMIGEDGIAAYGVIMYVNFIFIAAFLGYSIGCAPIISFHYGAENTDELKNLKNKSFLIIALTSVVMTALAMLLAAPLSSVFVGYDAELNALTQRAFILYSFSFLLVGFNIFTSAFFTALNNGFISALVSFFRLFLFEVVSVLCLPLILGTDGVWLSVVVAEALAIVLSVSCIIALRKKYQY